MDGVTIDEAIKHCEEVAEENQRVVDTGIVFDDVTVDMLYCDDTEEIEKHLANYQKCASEHRQLAEWLRELKMYREDTRFADLYERICIKRDEDRDYFARTKDQTYITRIAEKEVFIHMMQDMMFDRCGVEEVDDDEWRIR